MLLWQAILVLIFGALILIVSSDKAVNQLIKLAKLIGLSTFTIGFFIASLGSDLPEIVNSVISSYLGHGDISIGDSMGSVLSQISLMFQGALFLQLDYIPSSSLQWLWLY